MSAEKQVSFGNSERHIIGGARQQWFPIESNGRWLTGAHTGLSEQSKLLHLEGPCLCEMGWSLEK
jgi:hypothetical protein